MKKAVIFVVIVVTLGGFYGVYQYKKKPTDTHDERADFEIKAIDLVKEFSKNESAGTKKYVDRILIVTGRVREVDTASSTLFLDGSDPLVSITCSFYANETKQLQKLQPGDSVQVKGKCTGKLIDIVMNNCIIINSK